MMYLFEHKSTPKEILFLTNVGKVCLKTEQFVYIVTISTVKNMTILIFKEKFKLKNWKFLLIFDSIVFFPMFFFKYMYLWITTNKRYMYPLGNRTCMYQEKY